MGWTGRSVAVSVLLAVEEHRKQAGMRLVQLRETRGWNQEDLAHHADVSVKTISRFENGRHDGRRSTIEKMAQALGVEETAIVGDPPPVLGLGETQLDRLERKLDVLLATLVSDRERSSLPDEYRQIFEDLLPLESEEPRAPSRARRRHVG